MYPQFEKIIDYLWKCESRREVSSDELAEILDGSYINVLAALHALTGCDTTNKYATKMAALKVLEQYDENIISLGKEPVNESIMVAAEKFLVKCIDTKFNVTAFGQLCLSYCLSKGFKFNVVK